MPITKTQIEPTQLVLRMHNANGKNVGTSTAPVWKNPGDAPEVQNEASWFRTKTTSSERSPHPGVAKPRYISVVQKRRAFTRKKPVPPVNRPPRQPAPLIRRLGSTDKSYQQAYRKYMAKRHAWLKLVAEYDAKYRVRLQKFKSREIAYEEAKQAFLNKRLSLKKVRVEGKTSYTRNNPYSSTTVENNIVTYNYRKRTYVDLFYTGTTGGVKMYEWRVVRKYTPYVQAEELIVGKTTANWGVSQVTRLELPSQLSPATHIERATLKSVNSLYEQVSEQTLNVANMVAERAQTYEMLVDAIDALRKFLMSPKKAVAEALLFKVRGISKTTKSISDMFLKYCFGVEPFVSDVYAATQKMYNLYYGDAVSIVVRSGGSSKDYVTKVTESGYYTTVETTAIEVRVRHMLQYRISNSSLHSFNSWGLINPSQVAWEVMPWSFVIDWFIPVGKALASLSADAGLEFYSGTTSTEVITTRSVTRTFGKPSQSLDVWGFDAVGTVKRYNKTRTKTRTVLTSPPVRPLPRFKNPFSMRHVALSLALWRQRA